MTVTNDFWTSTAAGTPAGDLLRRFWFPIAPVGYLDSDPVKLVSVLSERLVFFRVGGGDAGLMQQRCPHNAVMLSEGHVDIDGIVCREHGWHFSLAGEASLKLPSRPFPLPRFKGVAYPVRVHGNLYWAYLGPEPAPPLPEDDVLVRADGYRIITVFPSLPHNWLADDWCEASHWRRQFGGTEAVPRESDSASPLSLRLPIDDRNTQQLSVEFVPSRSRAAAGTEVIYLDESKGWDEDTAGIPPADGNVLDRASLFQALSLLQ